MAGVQRAITAAKCCRERPFVCALVQEVCCSSVLELALFVQQALRLILSATTAAKGNIGNQMLT